MGVRNIVQEGKTRERERKREKDRDQKMYIKTRNDRPLKLKEQIVKINAQPNVCYSPLHNKHDLLNQYKQSVFQMVF